MLIYARKDLKIRLVFHILFKELKHAFFLDAEGNRMRKRTFRVALQWCLLDYYTNHP